MVKKVSNSKERLRELIMKMEITVEEPNSEQRLPNVAVNPLASAMGI